jgi:hypothetical protein
MTRLLSKIDAYIKSRRLKELEREKKGLDSEIKNEPLSVLKFTDFMKVGTFRISGSADENIGPLLDIWSRLAMDLSSKVNSFESVCMVDPTATNFLANIAAAKQSLGRS